jgi:hypothetical protein
MPYGYQKVMGLAIQLVPPYQKAIDKKINQGVFNDISDIEYLLTKNKLGTSLLKELENPNDSTVPAMLAWLYFGQSFERMVERGEELRQSSDCGYLQKFMFAATNKILVSPFNKLNQWLNM